MTEQDSELIEKWKFLLEDLPPLKSKQIKFASIYEKIAQNNKSRDIKLLLSIMYRVFKNLDDIKLSKRSSNNHEVGEFHDDDFYIAGNIVLVQFLAFCDSMAFQIQEKLLITGKIGYLSIKKFGQIKKIYITF